jgi:hypothetical protein
MLREKANKINKELLNIQNVNLFTYESSPKFSDQGLLRACFLLQNSRALCYLNLSFFRLHEACERSFLFLWIPQHKQRGDDK